MKTKHTFYRSDLQQLFFNEDFLITTHNSSVSILHTPAPQCFRFVFAFLFQYLQVANVSHVICFQSQVISYDAVYGCRRGFLISQWFLKNWVLRGFDGFLVFTTHGRSDFRQPVTSLVSSYNFTARYLKFQWLWAVTRSEQYCHFPCHIFAIITYRFLI